MENEHNHPIRYSSYDIRAIGNSRVFDSAGTIFVRIFLFFIYEIDNLHSGRSTDEKAYYRTL
jgi:hypothetical protein